MHVRAVTFDAAGTLIEVAEPVGRTYARAAARHGVVLDPAGVERRFRDAFGAAPPLAFPGVPPPDVDRHERSWWRTIVDAALGPGVDPSAAEATFEALFVYYARGEAWRVVPDAHTVLRALRARGMRLAVISNFDARLQPLLVQLGLAPFLDRLVVSARTGHAKPDAAIFISALTALAVDAGEALHVGDDVERDVAGAQAAGLHAVLLDRHGGKRPLPSAVPVVRTLTEVLALLDAPKRAPQP